MFRTLVELTPPVAIPPAKDPLKQDKANAVLAVHPLQISRWLEELWAEGGFSSFLWAPILSPGKTVLLGDPDAVSRTQLPRSLLNTLLSGIRPTLPAMPGGATPIQNYVAAPPQAIGIGLGATQPLMWEHLLYAYLVESTGIIDILGEVVRRYVVGESLPTPRVTTLGWVRSTEELYFRDNPLFSVGGLLTSQLRPDARINRRNVYWRMFGLDLPHPPGAGIDGQPWKRDIGTTPNSRFLELWSELLRQVWLGIENDRNQSGANPTDSSYIGYLCQSLSEMLQLRRRGGMLAREEFAYTTMLSWFHLTVEYDTSVVIDLGAEAGADGNPADRLAAIGARVGMSPSRQARELFELADLVSPLMWAIELGLFNDPGPAEMLFKIHDLPTTTPPTVAQTMNRIIDLWQSATGDRVKDLAVTTRRQAVPARPAQPTKLPSGQLVSPAPKPVSAATMPSTNGSRRPVPQA